MVADGEGRPADGAGPGSPPRWRPSTASTAPATREGGATPGRRTTRPSAPPTGRQHATAHHSPADHTSAEPAGLTSEHPTGSLAAQAREHAKLAREFAAREHAEAERLRWVGRAGIVGLREPPRPRRRGAQLVDSSVSGETQPNQNGWHRACFQVNGRLGCPEQTARARECPVEPAPGMPPAPSRTSTRARPGHHRAG